MANGPQTPDLNMDAAGLYREEVFTDNRIGTLRRMTPVKSDGSDDSSRPTLFVGSASLMTPAGSLPINFEIEADSLEDAVSKYGKEAEKAFEETVEELQKMRREAASGIVVPKGGAGPGGMPGGGMGGMGGLGGPGGMPGGGIQMP